VSYSANLVSFCTNFFLNRIFLEGFGLGSSTSFNIKTFDFIHFTTAGIPCDFWSVRAYYLNVSGTDGKQTKKTSISFSAKHVISLFNCGLKG